jgi:hypothetical protein
LSGSERATGFFRSDILDSSYGSEYIQPFS